MYSLKYGNEFESAWADLNKTYYLDQFANKIRCHFILKF